MISAMTSTSVESSHAHRRMRGVIALDRLVSMSNMDNIGPPSCSATQASGAVQQVISVVATSVGCCSATRSRSDGSTLTARLDATAAPHSGQRPSNCTPRRS